MATTTIDDSVRQSAQLIANLKQSLRLSEPTLVKLFEINVGWSLAANRQPAQDDGPHFDQAAADALLAKELGLNQQGPEANETLEGEPEPGDNVIAFTPAADETEQVAE